MQRIAKIFIWSSLCLGASHTALASELCRENAEEIRRLNGCSNGSTWQKPACFEIALACGDYTTLLSNLSAKTQGKTLSEYYWEGMAYYGLMNRTRSTGLRCEYFTQARRSVSYYLKTALFVMSGRDLKNEFAPPVPDQVFRATKVQEELSRVKGCVEDGLTINEIESVSEKLTSKAVEDAFIRSSSDQREVMKPLYTEIQNLVTKSATVETNIGLKSVAADTVEYYMNGQILEDWASIGNVSNQTANFRADTSKAETLKQSIALPLLNDAKVIGDALAQAIKGCDPARFPRQSAQEYYNISDEAWVAMSAEQKAEKEKDSHTFPVRTAQQYFGISKSEWDAMTPAGRAEREAEKQKLMCSSQAAQRFAEAADFQRLNARAASERAKGYIGLLQKESSVVTNTLASFKNNTRVDGVKPLKKSVEELAVSWLYFGNDKTGRFSSRCEEPEYANSWFCVKP